MRDLEELITSDTVILCKNASSELRIINNNGLPTPDYIIDVEGA